MRPLAWSVGAVLLALAGCLSAVESPAGVDPAAAAPAPGQASFSLRGTGCVEGGFVAAYTTFPGEMPVLAGVWQTADASDEIGNPVHDSRGAPAIGPLFANWHMGFRCASVESSGGSASDYPFGYVGQMIEAPAFDPGGADLHFVLTGFGFGEGAVADAHVASTTAAITPAVAAEVQWLSPKEQPRSAAYVLYVDAVKGTYESWSTMAFLRDVPERTIRFWWQVPADGSRGDAGHDHGGGGGGDPAEENATWNPVYWDLRVSAARQYTTPPVDGVEWAAHNMLDDEHFPAIFGQPTLTNVYEYESLELTLGEVLPHVVIDDLWTH